MIGRLVVAFDFVAANCIQQEHLKFQHGCVAFRDQMVTSYFFLVCACDFVNYRLYIYIYIYS